MPNLPLVRRRRTTPVAEAPPNPVTNEMRELAERFHIENTKKNIADGIAKKARTALFAAMETAGITIFDTIIHIDEQPVTLETKVANKEKVVIDMALLKTLTTKDQYDKIVSATKGDIETYAGKDICTQVSSTKATDEREVYVGIKGAPKRGRPRP